MMATVTTTTKMLLALAAMIAAMLAVNVMPASAGHCADNGGPGHSDFARHAQAHGDEGSHYGWASCEEGAMNSKGEPGSKG